MQTPLMKQYGELKAQAGNAMLLFRMGDFYELFGEDAVEAARILEITLTSRDKNKPDPIPMAGVPHHSVQSYIQRLLKAGKKVALGEQIGSPDAPENAKIVRREITRVFTPAIQFDQEGSETLYLATAIPEASATRSQARWTLACLDSSTGEARVSDALNDDQLNDELGRLPIRHFLRIGHQLPEQSAHLLRENRGILLEDLAANYLSPAQSQDFLKRQYGLSQLDAFLASQEKAHALGILAVYVARTQGQERIAHLRLPEPLHQPERLRFGSRTPQHLDLIPGLDGTPNLFDLINRTRSALGARTLRKWLLEPLVSPQEIRVRQEGVREIAKVSSARLASHLGSVYDLERIVGRVTTKLANPRDTLALGRTLALLTEISRELSSAKSPALSNLHARLEKTATELGALAERIITSQKEDAPLLARDGGIFAIGTHAELDRLIRLNEEGSRWLVELETREREATGIPSLKVRYNRVFGYFIEVTQAHLKNVPSHYQRKQTTVGAERFFTEELKKFEDEIVTAGSRQKALEQELFEDLVAAIAEKIPTIMDAALALGELDSVQALAQLASEPGWAFPQIDESMDLFIRAGRHPLVDAGTGGSFVPNDTTLTPGSCQTLLITGPNMGGKSTVMRQVALIVVLGQMGAPVPAAEARWGVVSSLHTRIGAHDAISRGQSTFMVEMSELAQILHFADARSLIILDEIGRGTSTYDGMSVAWSTLEWITTRIGARTLFATHYHELTRLEGRLPGLANAHMEVEGGRTGQVRFLYLLKDGAANESFGIQVARLAGLPAPVIERAWQVLGDLEKSSLDATSMGDPRSEQLSLFDSPRAIPSSQTSGKSPGSLAGVLQAQAPQTAPAPAQPHPAVEELAEIDINGLTPLDALNLLARLRGMISS